MSADRERVVEVEHDGRRFTFRIEHEPPLAFWRVESDRGSYRWPIRVMGGEQPEFFRSLAALVAKELGL